MHITYTQILFLCIAAFTAGFVDAVVGGGGLIQTPATLVLLPSFPVASAIGSTKIPSFCGTFFAARQYLKKVQLNWSLITLMCTLAFFSSFGGSLLLTKVSNGFMKPVLLVVLCGVAIYTYTKKDFGQEEKRATNTNKQFLAGSLISIIIGFYDGFIGPGAGSFFILAFIAVLGFDFLHASAGAKMVNLATNLGSIILFGLKGKIIWAAALPMALCNAMGGMLGARLALAKGNRFIRIFFLVMVLATLVRFGWDVFAAK